MKRFFIVLISIAAIISLGFNIAQINSKRRISDNISGYIFANIHQLASFYETMYLNDEPNEYFEASLIYADDVCDSIKEEIVFYNTIYPGRDMLLSYLIDDYKLLIRVMKNNSELTEEAQLLHKQLQQYILDYCSDNVGYSNNPAKKLYETDKQIKTTDNGNRYLLHDEIVKLSKR